MNKLFTVIRIATCISLMSLQVSAQNEKFCGQKVVGYVPYYRSTSQIAAVDYKNLTHAFFAFVFPTANGTLKTFTGYEKTQFNNSLNSFITNADKGGAKKVISMGGQYGGTDFLNLSVDSAYRHKLADTLISFCKKYNFVGADLDWEGLSSDEEYNGYLLLCKTLGTRLHAENLLFIATVPASGYNGDFFPEDGLKYADWIQAMSYDATGTWAQSPYGNHSSYELHVSAHNYWKGRGIADDKIIVGVPFYGYKFTSKSGGSGTALSYASIIAKYPNLADNINETDDFTWFNGPQLIRDKVQYSLDKKLGGIMIWEMTQDALGAKSLHKVIVDKYNGVCPIAGLDDLTSAKIDFIITENTISILNNDIKEKGDFSIYNLQGQRIATATLASGQTTAAFDNRLPKDSFLVLVSNLDGKTYSYKFSIQ